ncbi:hypothetical protein BKA65DRAFT_581996 [Rhexocercosporidium sp. MPI-PUGE-AT-0058]|nr:hypothetical protein BKA65DRAFT_581996 [Rhexocercosporidium sp. MPI-PUGE-AT-0058]
MDRIAHPLPTASELTSAILILSRTFQSLRLKHGLIDSSAIFLHATAFSLPCLLPSSITFLIQPSPTLSALELTGSLSDRKFVADFIVTRKDGVDYPKAIIKRPKDDIRGDLLVEFSIVDHWMCHERREAYDFRIPGNDTVPLMVRGEQVHVMNPEWLLRQKIQIWNERVLDKEKRTDEIDIRTLVDVLGFRGSRKISFRRKKEVEDLNMVVMGMDGDDPMVLGSVIDCPQVFGPWYDLTWVRAIGAVGSVLILMKVLDFYAPDYDL